jgi:hypothetical protein
VEPQRNVSGDDDQRWFEGGDWNRGRHGAAADGSGAYHAAEEEYTGDVRGPYGEPPIASPQPTPPDEVQRHTTEPIDVGAMRRPPVSSPPAATYPPPPAYGGGPEQPLYPAGPGHATPEPALSAPTAAVHTIPPPRQAPHQAPHQVGLGPSVYQSRKPVVLATLIALTVLFEIPALRLLASATLADSVPANGVVSGTFLVLGIPVFAYGLYGMLGGGPVSANPATWLRQPLIYVPLGVLLFLFAALAA